MTTTKRRPRRSRRMITLALIARDEEQLIEECLRSARPVVDEIVVIDTGSSDRTVEIAREFGARVKQVPWRDDFSAARNASVAEARGEFLLQLDADERLVEESRDAIGRAVRERDKDYWRLKLTNIGPDGPAGETVRALRLFRLTPRFRFIGRIHEQPLLERPDRGGLCDAEILHLGYDPEIFAAKGKQARNRRLIELALAESERADDPRLRSLYLFYHALQGSGEDGAARFESFAEYVRAHETSLEGRMPWIPCGMIHHACKLRNRDQWRQAAETAEWVRRRYGDSPVLDALSAQRSAREGRLEEAESLLERSLGRRLDAGSIHQEYHLLPGLAERLVLAAKGEIRERQQRWEDAEQVYRLLDGPLVGVKSRLACVRAAQGKWAEALETLESRPTPGDAAEPDLACLGFILSLLSESTRGLLLWGERTRAAAPTSPLCAGVLERVESGAAQAPFGAEDFPELETVLRLPPAEAG